MRQITQILTIASLGLLVAVGRPAYAADDAEELLRYLPPYSNVVAVVRIREIHDSPRAKREGWKEETINFLAGADTIPTWADALVLGTQFQPGSSQSWTASAVLCPRGVSVEAMASSENRELQELGGVNAMHTKRDAYFLQLSPSVLGVMSPALRQESARWVRSATRATEPQLSSYLIEEASSPSHVVMAIDMMDMLDPKLIRHRLRSTQIGRDDDELVEQLVELFKGLKGVALHIQIEDDTDARIDLAFSDELPDEADAFKTLLLEMLRDEGLMLQNLKDATPSIDGSVFSVVTKLSDEDLRGVMTFILSPYPTTPDSSGAIATVDEPVQPSTDDEPGDDANQADAVNEEVAQKNRKYYIAVQRAIDDARQRANNAIGYDQSAGYLDRYASKIDNLAREDIDPVLLEFAAYCSDQLRTLAASTRVMVTDVNTQEGTITTQVTSAGATPYVTGVSRSRRWWGRDRVHWGLAPHWNVESNLKDVRERQASSITNFGGHAQEIRLDMDNQSAEVKRQMEEKYGIKFSGFGF